MSSLGEFHHEEEGPTKAHKIVGGIVIALIVGGIAFFVLDSGILNSHPSQTAQAKKAVAKHAPRGIDHWRSATMPADAASTTITSGW